MFRHSRRYPTAYVLRLHGHRTVRRTAWGAMLIVLGIGYLLRNQGLIATADLWLIAPAMVALSGLAHLVVAPGLASLASAALRLAVAAYLVVVIEHIGGWTFAATWPVLLIAAGVGMVARSLGRRDVVEEPTW